VSHRDHVVREAANRLSDLLTMLGVDPEERPEHGGPSTSEVLASAALKPFLFLFEEGA
jgi:hypothetical protein